jgi:hypothetical protein
LPATTPRIDPSRPLLARLRALRAAGVCAAALLAVAATPALAADGGISASPPPPAPTGHAKLQDGRAIAPSDAPRRVVRVIRAANEIARGHGYCYGGGHKAEGCYDCSGAVSYALLGGDFIDSPLNSTGFMSWGRRGKGRWITVYANSGHAYAVIAGLRFDTSMTPGAGPGWSEEMRSSAGYRARHKGRF